MSASVGRGYVASLTTVGAINPLPQITTLTVGGVFAAGETLYATLGGVTYSRISLIGDVNLDGVASGLGAVIDAAASYTATTVGAVITVTGPVSNSFPVIAGNLPGNNTTALNLVQTASDDVAGVSAEFYVGWYLERGYSVIPLNTTFFLTLTRASPPLNLTYSYNSTPSGRTNYEVLAIAASEIRAAFVTSGDREAYGLDLRFQFEQPGGNVLSFFTPSSDPFNWSATAQANDPSVLANVTWRGTGVAAASLRPQIITLTLAGTPTTGWTYRATLAGVDFDYVALVTDVTMSMVAIGLAAVIDANVDFIASAVGAVITITHASNNVAFTYSATIIPGTMTLTAATTQEAA
jgi:hypothetical protein